MKTNFSKRLLSVFLCLTLIITYLPLSSIAAETGTSTSVADLKTLSDWETWFSADSSRYAGGVFVDKSVYTATEAKTDAYFEDIRSSLSFGNDNFGNENFMIALSALGSNSEVLGYSHTPTDTILVLDASTSMGTGTASSSSIDDMVSGANEAIKRLLALNHYNRVGVVIYNGTSSVLLPLDRYTSGNANGDILVYVRSSNQNRIRIASNVKDGNGESVNTSYIAQAQGTYTQGGIYAAAQEFLAADTVIEDGKIQGGTKRLPIMVLMTDGEPSYRTQTGSNNTINKYSAATNSNVDKSAFREDDITAFSTMLTAAWAEAEITAHYGMDTRFYTLGYALSANHQYAQNVLDPMNPNNSLANRFAGYASQYLALQQNATAAFRNENNQVAFRVTRASSPDKVTSLDYVDRYWQASHASQLSTAFDAIVDEIIIQSRYYSTLVSNNNYAQDGFISFTDEIGTYMEVKNIKGIYIGDGKLISGGMFSEFATTGTVKDYDNTNYSDEDLDGFENEILSAVSERFSISLEEAFLLIQVAKDNGFISYSSPDAFSNYIAWYADEDNNYLAPYTNAAVEAQNSAKYIVRSYFYMGDVTQNHVETSMLYALVRVREDIETGRQIVDINVPAALLPLVTYTITVDGDVLSSENITGITCQQKKPISLLFEVGLDSEITPINITQKVGEDFRKDENGVYTFYTNRWRDDRGGSFTISNAPDPHIFNHGILNTTVVQFIPSLENERYYYTENMQILDSNYHVYTGAKPTVGGTYYIVYKWVEGDANNAVLKTAYDLVSPKILEDGGNLIQIDGKEGWFIKKGTPQYYFGEEVHGEQGHTHKTDEHITNTLAFANYPQIVHHDSESHSGYHVLNYLGNNGLLKASPAQGIKLSKTVSQAVADAPDSFEFEIALSGTVLANSYPVYIEHADGNTNSTTATVTGGKLSVTLSDGDIAYIYDLPAGTAYRVTEKYHPDYTASSANAEGTVALHTLSSVDFVNSPKGYGSLLVEKDVTHPFATVSDALANKEFDITVTFEGDANDLMQIKVPVNSGLVPTVEDGTYTYSFKLKNGYDLLFADIPEGVEYTVSEHNLPAGFTLVTTDLAGEISKDTQSEVLLVNDYKPAPISPNITISGEKTLTGRPWNAETDKYQVALQQVVFGGQEAVAVGEPTVVDIVKTQNADYAIDMSSILYSETGTYNYTVYEVPGNVDSVSYDTSFAVFSVSVSDNGTGTLIVDGVTVHLNTAAMSGNTEDGWTITKDFTNRYQAATVRFPAVKQVVDEEDNSVVQSHRGGIMFALYASPEDETPVYSALTDEQGNASFAFAVKQSDYETAKYYYLREVIPPINTQVVGMTYDTAFKYVIAVAWPDVNAAAPTVKYYHYSAAAANGLGSEIADIEATPLVFTNTYDDGVVSSPGIELGGKKTLNGGALRPNDSFTFELYETDAAFHISGHTPVQTVTVDSQTENGAYKFEGITFHSVGTKYLVVSEKPGNAGGIGYDNTRYHITVDVTKTTNADNKTVLTATITHIHQVGNGDVAVNALNFNNTYSINDTEEITVKGHKHLLGRNLFEGEFAFGIYEEGSNTPLYTVLNDKDGYFTFPTITYEIAGEKSYNKTYTYTVKEIIPDGDKKGITYNSNGKLEYTVVVNLKDDGNGGITKTVTLDGQTVSDILVAFENSYTATDTSLTLSGTKTFNNDSGEFYFDLYETGNNFTIAAGTVPKTAKATVTNGSGKYTITLNYTNADRGYHYYVLKEAVPAKTNGVLYDSTQYYITVNVLDNGNGELEAHVMRVISAHTSDTVTITTLNFTNKYVAAATEYVIRGEKTLTGNKALKADMFEFRLSNADGEIATVKNDGSGDFAFPAQIFEKAGDYVFYVEELNGGSTIKGITYDNAKFIITVPVRDDGVGNLYVDETNIRIQKDIGGQKATAPAISFVNAYNASATDKLYLDGTKQIKDNTKPLLEKEFTFELYEADENFKKGDFVESAKNTAGGSFKFDKEFRFDKAGTFYYLILEKKGDADYITYDETVYGITFTVKDDGEGKLNTTKEISVITDNGVTKAEKVEFINEYKPADAKITISGEKVLAGRNLKADEFKFFLYPADDAYAVDEEATAIEAKNDADGNFAFDTIVFEEIGTYYFVIREDANTTAERVTNDTAVYHVAIEIKDDANGKLYEASRKITKAGSAEAAESIVFNNIFTPKPEDITVNIGVAKTIVNKGSKKIGPEGFEFILKNTATNEQLHAKSDAAGNAAFTLGYTEDDIGKTYTYKLTELNGGKTNVIYSTVEYTVTVTISLNENNVLIATLTKNGENATAVVAVFENVYDYTPAPDPDPEPVHPGNPQTGDNTNLHLWFALLFVSSGGLIGATLSSKKRKTEES